MMDLIKPFKNKRRGFEVHFIFHVFKKLQLPNLLKNCKVGMAKINIEHIYMFLQE